MRLRKRFGFGKISGIPLDEIKKRSAQR